jgi:hypothetical protein
MKLDSDSAASGQATTHQSAIRFKTDHNRAFVHYRSRTFRAAISNICATV